MIKFISEQFKNNDENTKVKKEDTWSFEKLIKSKNPNWFLSSTQFEKLFKIVKKNKIK